MHYEGLFSFPARYQISGAQSTRFRDLMSTKFHRLERKRDESRNLICCDFFDTKPDIVGLSAPKASKVFKSIFMTVLSTKIIRDSYKFYTYET